MIGYKAIVFDMDGTLLDGNNRLDPELVECLGVLRNRGIKLMIATGRTFGEVLDVIGDVTFDGYICSNGMTIYDDQRDQLRARSLDTDKIYEAAVEASRRELYYEIRHEYGSPFIMADHFKYMEEMLSVQQPSEVSDHEWSSRKLALTDLKRVDDKHFIDYLTKDSVVKIYFFAPEKEKVDAWKMFLNQTFDLKLFSVESSSANSCEIVSGDVSKGEAVEFLMEKQEISLDEVICFGDGTNDISMFNVVNYAIAMSNAGIEVKRASDGVTSHSNEQQGVLKWLKQNI
ncbi:Cof-type HAD-IIB family hydrolase [Alkalibacillus aidingensis]|uniref:Cof-type HAD-IIB family hydrolase n=1 Tax=Alkalibacillus aidingensis TaxID=2747607 RepID=UPI00166155A7|nr:Cof-type HAD-IIB family hydrolase [Alkalibacillus aidingensis]